MSFIALFIVDFLFFNSFSSLLNISCIFFIYVSSLIIHASILFSGIWIIFTVFILNSVSGQLPISSVFVWSGGFLPCSFICCIFLCLFILFSLLCLGVSFLQAGRLLFLLTVESAPHLPPPTVGGFGWVVCDDFLVGGTCACVLLDGSGSHLWAGPCPIMSFCVSMCPIYLWTACLLVCSTVFLFCWRICIRYLGTGACWALGGLGFGVEMETSWNTLIW